MTAIQKNEMMCCCMMQATMCARLFRRTSFKFE